MAIEQIGVKPILDFEVFGTHCYVAAGAIHHNCGKTLSAAAEVAYHSTGRYPDWWPGKKFNRGTKGWVVSEDMKFSRDNAQRLLMGEPGEWGTGYIPYDSIVKINRARHSVDDAIDTVLVRHTSGRISKVMFKSAEVPRNKLGGDTLDWGWIDEEIPYDHYEEVLTRTNVTQGPVWTTFTPLKGKTALVMRFLYDKVPGTKDIVMTIYDAEHYTPEQRAAIIASYSPKTRKARTMGEPTLEGGLIFTTPEDKILVRPFKIPDHFAHICGLDFGIDHPFAMAHFAVDRAKDITYLYNGYKASDETPSQHFAPYRELGPWIPAAWPADALQRGKDTGVQLAATYRKNGFRMLRSKAMLPPQKNEKGKDEIQAAMLVDPQLVEMADAMDAGKFKVFEQVTPFWEEYPLYHRNEKGAIVKVGEDFMSASRYGWIMRRFAQTYGETIPSRLEPMVYSDRV